MKLAQEIYLKKRTTDSPFHLIRQPSKRPFWIGKLICSNTEGVHFIDQSKILYCQSKGNYALIFLLEGKSIMLSKTLKWVEKELNNEFFLRTHHSYLINTSHLALYSKSESIVQLTNDTKIPIARSKKPLIENLIFNQNN